MNRASAPVLLLLMLLNAFLLQSCHVNTSYSNRASDKEDAEKVARRFYDLQKAGDYDNLSKLYSKQLSKGSYSISPVQLQAMQEQLGDVKEITLEDWKTEVRTGTDPGARYDLLYQVVRSKRMARETLGLIMEGDSIRIDNYDVESGGRHLLSNGETGPGQVQN